MGSCGSQIVLVACYELGHQPLSVAWPAAFLREAGFETRCVDVSVCALEEEPLRRARFVGIAVPMHTALRLGEGVARKVRSLNRDAHICFFGHYAWLNSAYLLEECLADSIIAGECEAPLVQLVQNVSRGLGDPIPGVSRRHGEEKPHVRRLAFPVPLRESLPGLDCYAKLEWNGRTVPAAAVEASRGCRHMCLHCPVTPIYRGRFFVVPVETVMRDIRQVVQKGAAHVTFSDPDFLNGPGHAMKVARSLHAEFPGATFDVTAKIGHLLKHRTLLPELKDSGCIFIVSAVESLNDSVLEELDKGHTRTEVFEAVSIVHGAGIALRPSLMPFSPWETLGSYCEILDWVARDGLVDHIDPVQYGIRLLIPPGSALLQRPGIRPYLGDLEPAGFSHPWTHPEPRMDELCAEVQRIVEGAASHGEDSGETFDKVRASAFRAAGRSKARSFELRRSRAAPPRITEPWFC